jgi:hypothetical protein
MERAMSSVFGNSAPKAKASSPRATPAPEGPKKRKALPSGSGQAKKKNGASGISSSAASSPVLTTLPDPKMPSRVSPTPTSVPRPASSRARQNSIQSNNMETGRSRPASAAPSKPNGSTPVTSDVPVPTISQRPNIEVKSVKESSAPARTETVKTEVEKSESSAAPTPVVAATAKKDKDKEKEKEKENEQDADKDNENDAKAEEAEKKSESAPPAVPVTTTVTTKSGRASKPSTPALATFQEAARPRSSRNTESTGGSKKGHRKSSSVAQIILPPPTEGVATSTLPGDVEDEDGDIDADEPTYCYCNSVSYGEMVACDADGCPREWFHLACVGLRVAPGSKSKMPSTFAVIVSSRLTWRALQRNGTAKTAKNG